MTVRRRLYHVTIPAIAIVEADSPEAAEAFVARAIDRAGFYAYEADRVVFESEDVPDEDVYAGVPRGWRG